MKSRINKTLLQNGVRILTKKMPYSNSVSMGLWVDVGARDEDQAESGLSHFIEHMIFKGTEKRTAYQIAKEFDAIGGQSNAFTTMETTCYHAKVMDTQIETMVDILSDIFLNSVFDPAEVEKERPVIFQEIGMVEDSPEEYIHVLAGKTYWGDNGLGHSILGTRENIIGFNSEMIKHFFHQNYQPNRILISAGGNVEHERFLDLVGPAFESICPGGKVPRRQTPVGRSLVEIHNRTLEQVQLCLITKGLPISDPRRYAFSLLNTILGGNMSSRLFQAIREQHALAYTVYSFISSFVDTGVLGTYVGVSPEKAHAALKLILEEMRKLCESYVASSELRDAKQYTKGSLLLASESVDNQMVRLAQNDIHFGEYVPMETVLEKIDSVSEAEILELARDLFKTNQFALTLLGSVTNKISFESLLVS